VKVPAGTEASDLGAALGAFANALGHEWVFTSDADVDLYRDAYSPVRGTSDERVPSAAIAPASVEQVQAVVRIANQYRVPLYPISTGRNLTYGGSAPVLSGSVVLDLKRMNRVIEVNEPGAYCIVEPGVSYFDLYRHIRDHHLKVRIDPPDPGWGSPVGNSLEHGVGRGPHRDHFRAHCGLEVVTGTGDLLRTGMGALPNSGSLWPRFRYGYGPYIDGIFSSSNFGVVTKMGVHLLPEPELTRVFDLSIARYQDLDEFVQELAQLFDVGVLNSISQMNMPLLSMQIPAARRLLESPGGGTSAQWNALGGRLGLPPWRIMQLNCQGPAKIVAAQYDYVIDRMSRFAGFKLIDQRNYPGGVDPERVPGQDKCALGIPSLVIFDGVAMARGHGHLDFSPAYPMTGEAVRKVNSLLQQGHREAGVPWRGWAGGNTWFDKTFTMISGFQLTNDPQQNASAVAAFRHLVQLLGANGFAEYRTHPIFQDLLASQYSFNDHALLRFNQSIKDAIDPRGVLAAGRAGIWPKYLRDQGKGPA
jgi:4-cresol dehydrogenase (hydroxylating)